MLNMNNLKTTFFQYIKGKEKIVVIFILIVFFALLIGTLFYCQFFTKGNEENNLIKTKEKQSIEGENQELTIPEVLYNLTGKITGFQDATIIFNAEIPQFDKNNQMIKKYELRKAITDSTTKFTYLEIITHKETGQKIPKETQIYFKNLKVGDYIEAISSENISNKVEFSATQIRLLSPKKP